MKSFVSTSEVNELCEALVLDYVKGSSKSFCVDIEGFITEYLKLNIVYAPFAEDDLTKEGFLSDGIHPVRIYRNGRKEEHVFPRYTIVLDQYLLHEAESGRRRFTFDIYVKKYNGTVITKRNPP